MKNQIIPLVTSLSIAALLCCCVVLLMSMMPSVSKPAPAPSVQKTDRLTLFSLSPSEIDTIELSHGPESLQLVNMGDRLVLESWEDVPLFFDATTQLLSLLKSFPAEKRLAAYSDESQELYGFDAPYASAVITPVQSPPIALVLGDPIGEDMLYLTDHHSVYCVSSQAVSPLLLSKTDFVDRTLTPPAPKELEHGILRLSGTRYPDVLTIEITFSEKGNSYRMLTPEEKPLPREACQPLVDSLFDFTADAAVLLTPSAEQLHAAGMEQPYCIAECELDGKRMELIASPPQKDGSIFLMNESIPVLFQTSAQPLEWLSTDPSILTSAILLPTEYDETARIVISSPTETFRFTKWDGQVLCNSRPIDAELFHRFYTQSLAITPKKRAITPPLSTTSLLVITIGYNNPERPSDVLELLPGPEGYVYLSYNKSIEFLADEQIPSLILQHCHALLEQHPAPSAS